MDVRRDDCGPAEKLVEQPSRAAGLRWKWGEGMVKLFASQWEFSMKTFLLTALTVASSVLVQTSVQANPVPVAYVDSVSGLDGNASSGCIRTSPCKTITAALTVVTNPGIVVVTADSEFAPFTISTGVTITCPGVTCIVNSSGGLTGLTIAAGANDTVILRHFSVTGLGTGGTGILVNSVGKLELHDSRIGGNSVNLNFAPSSGQAHLYMYGSEISYATNQNIILAPTSSIPVSALISKSWIHHSAAGIKADATQGGGGVSVVVEDTKINFTGNQGVAAVANGSGCPSSPSGPFARFIFTRSVVSFSSGTNLNANGCSAQMVLDNTLVTQASTGVTIQNGGNVVSDSTNAILFNSTNVNGTLNHQSLQ
jgi:hypothetical protein